MVGFGQVDVGPVVQVPILFRSNEGQMRLEEANRQEERLVHLRQSPQVLDGFLGQLAIGVGIVRAHRRLRRPGHGHPCSWPVPPHFREAGSWVPMVATPVPTSLRRCLSG